MPIGQINEFCLQTGNWSTYVERVEIYFRVNKVRDNHKLSTLLLVMGEETYEVLSALSSPHKPSMLTYACVVDLLKNNFQPKPSTLKERYKFRQRRQLHNEAVEDFVEALTQLSVHCGFEHNKEENLLDQFVYGVRSETIRQRLFAEENLSYERAVRLALSLEESEEERAIPVLCKCSTWVGQWYQANEIEPTDIYINNAYSEFQQIDHPTRTWPRVGTWYMDEGEGDYERNRSLGGRGVNRGGRRLNHGQRGTARSTRARAPVHRVRMRSEPEVYYTTTTEEQENYDNDYSEAPQNGHSIRTRPGVGVWHTEYDRSDLVEEGEADYERNRSLGGRGANRGGRRLNHEQRGAARSTRARAPVHRMRMRNEPEVYYTRTTEEQENYDNDYSRYSEAPQNGHSTRTRPGVGVCHTEYDRSSPVAEGEADYERNRSLGGRGTNRGGRRLNHRQRGAARSTRARAPVHRVRMRSEPEVYYNSTETDEHEDNDHQPNGTGSKWNWREFFGF